MEKKAQSSIEYLATYGWALLLMFLVIAFLVGSGVFSPSRFANEECTFQPNLPCTQYYAQAVEGRAQARISFNLTNTMGFPIAIIGVNSDSEGVKSSCANCKRYLLQGESATFTFEPLTSREYYDNEMIKLKLSLQFRGCKGIDKNACLNDDTLAYYTTSGRIHAAMRGTTAPGASPLCTSADNWCDGTVFNFCSGGVWQSNNCAPGTCTGKGASAACASSSCTPADEFCDGQVRNFCQDGNLVGEYCENGCSSTPAPHCKLCKDGETSCLSEREISTCNGESWESIYCQDLDASKEYCSEFLGAPQCTQCISGKIKCIPGTNLYKTCDGEQWMAYPTYPCMDPTPICKDGGINGDDACVAN